MFYKANDKYNSNLSAGYTAGQTTLSVSETPDNVPTIITAGFGTDKEITFAVTGKALGTLTGVSRLRGYAGNLDAQTAVTCLNNEEFVNQTQNAVSTPESLAPVLYAVDGGSNDTYVIAVDVPPTSYVAGMIFTFKANTANTGACTLNVNSLGAKAIKKAGTSDLNDGDIGANQIVTVVYDGTNFQMIGGNVAKSSSAEIDLGLEENKFITPKELDGSKVVFTDKSQTITKPTLAGSVQAVTTDADGATVTFDLASSNVHQVVLGGNRTLAISNGVVGQYFAIELIQDGTGSRTVTWFSTIKWVGNTAPTLTTTGGKKDTFMFRVTGSNTYDGYIVGMNI